MKHRIPSFLSLLFLLFASNLSAQFAWTENGYSSSFDRAKSIATDPAGNSYVVGEMNAPSTTVMTLEGPVTLTGNGAIDMFIAKYNPDGGLLWIKNFGGSGNDRVSRVATNGTCLISVVGSFDSDDLAFGALPTLPPSALNDGYIVTFDPEGTPQWAHSIEGPRWDRYTDVEMMDNGIVAVGILDSPDITIEGTNLINNSDPFKKDILMTRYDLEGNVVWTQNHGGAGTEAAMGLAINGDRIYMVGYYYSNTGGTLTLDGMTTGPCLGDADMFLTKFDANDPNDFSWLVHGGGLESDYFYDITTDKADGVYIHGSTASTTFITSGLAPATVPPATGMNILTLKYSETDGSATWLRQGIGSGSDNASSIKADGCGNVYITGSFGAPSINFGPILTATASSNVYLVRYNSAGAVIAAETPNASGSGGWGAGVAIGRENNPVLIGSFKGNITFPGAVLTSSTSPTAYDVFVTEYKANLAPNWQHASSATTGEASGVDVTVDASGDVYTTGTFSGSTTLGTGGDTWTLTGEGMYVAKYSACGRLAWAAQSLNPGIDARGITLDKTNGWVYVCGNFDNSALKTFQSGRTPDGEGCGVSMGGGGNSYLARYSMANGCLLDLKIFGAEHKSNAVATDKEGNVYVAHEYIFAWENKISAGKYDENLDLVWEKSSDAPVGYDCKANDIVVHTALSGEKRVYLTGSFFNQLSVDMFTINSPQIWDAWVLSLTDTGSGAATNWFKKGDANRYSSGQSIAVDPEGNPYVTGSFENLMSAAFGGGAVTGVPFVRSAFVARLNPLTGIPLWANPITSSHGVYGTGISADKSGLYLTGYWHGGQGMDPIVFPASQGIAPIDWNGNPDPALYNIYLARYSFDNVPGSNWGAISEGDNLHQAFGIAVNNSGYCYTTGGFKSAMGLAPTYIAPLGMLVSTFGIQDAFLIRTEKTFGDFLKSQPGNATHRELSSGSGPIVYPNPGSGTFKVLFPEGEQAQLEVYDIHGKLLRSLHTPNGQAELQLNDCPAGIYFLSWKDQNGQSGNVKLLIN